MLGVEAIEEAAQALASAVKREGAITTARTALSDMKHAVETILGREVEVLKRTSHSTGTERLSFGIGHFDVRPTSRRSWVSAEEADATCAVRDKAQEVAEYLKSTGVKAEVVNLGTEQRHIARHSVDVILDEQVLGYVPGRNTAAVRIRGGVEPTSRVMAAHPDVDKAAGILAAEQGEHVLNQVKTSLIGLKKVVGSVLGREPELLVRTSRSTGKQHLSVVLAEAAAGPVYDMEPRAKEVCQYLQSEGVEANLNTIKSERPGMVRYVLDMPLDGLKAIVEHGRGGGGRS